MRKKTKIMIITVVSSILLATLYLYATDYSVNITRKGQDLYKIEQTSLYVRTQYCYEYCNNQEAVIKYSGNYGYTKGKLIFSNGQDYDVKGVYEGFEPDRGTIAVDSYGNIVEVDFILVPTKLN